MPCSKLTVLILNLVNFFNRISFKRKSNQLIDLIWMSQNRIEGLRFEGFSREREREHSLRNCKTTKKRHWAIWASRRPTAKQPAQFENKNHHRITRNVIEIYSLKKTIKKLLAYES